MLHNFVSEKWQRHDSTHFTPVIAVDGEDHVLSIAGEYVEHHVSRAGAKLYALVVEDLGG